MTGSSRDERAEPSAARNVSAVLLAAALGIVPLAAPLPGLLLHLFTPAPVLWLVWRGERRAALGAGAAVVAAAGLLGGGVYLVQVAEFVAPMALVLARAVAGGWSAGRAVLVATLATLAVGLVGLLSQGDDPIAVARRQAEEAARMLAEVARRDVGETVDPAPVAAWLLRIQPALALVVVGTVAWLNLAVIRRIATGWAALDLGPAAEEGVRRPPFDAWFEWRAPEPLVFVLILGGLLLLPGREAFTAIGLNLLIVVGLIYIWQGLAVVGFVFRVRRVPLPLRGAGYALAALQPVLAVMVGVLGLADLWVDFRGRARRAAGGAADDGSGGQGT